MDVSGYCEIVELSRIDHAPGYPCGKHAAGECCDCGTRVCSDHAQRCLRCEQLFCVSCLSFHETTLPKKPARDECLKEFREKVGVIR